MLLIEDNSQRRVRKKKILGEEEVVENVSIYLGGG